MKKILSALLSVSLLGSSVYNLTAETAKTPAAAEIKQGDVNSDGKIDAADVLTILNFFFGDKTLSSAPFDLNGDKKVNIVDLIQCKSIILNAGKSSDFAIQNDVLNKYTGISPIAEIPDYVTVISVGAFQSCNITGVVIPGSVSTISTSAFRYCSKLREVTIPGSVKLIGKEAFEYCSSLKNVYIESGCKTIGDSAFAYCQNLKDVTIPSTVTSVLKSSFRGCSESLTVHCPEGSFAEQFAIENGFSYDNNMEPIETKDEPAAEVTTTVYEPPVTTAALTEPGIIGVTTTAVTTAPAVSSATTTALTTAVSDNGTTSVSESAPKPVTTNVTTNVTANVTTNVTTDVTTNITTNVTTTVTTPVTTRVTAPVKFDIRNIPQFSVSSENLSNGAWDAVISNTEKGSNSSPQLSWEPVENAGNYVIYMIDTSAGNWMHWRSGNITQTSLPEGWANPREYIGPYPPSGTHRYVVYVFALKNSVSKLNGSFDDENRNFNDIIKSLDVDSDGNSGNMISYGTISGTYRR